MPDVLIYADTERSATLRHEVPLAIGDPFLYLEVDGRRVITTNALEAERIARVVPDAQVVLGDELGMFELVDAGFSRAQIELELIVRTAERVGLAAAAVPPELPVAVADRLRAAGVQLTVDTELFAARRRVKNEAELAGIRRAQHAAQMAMAAAATVLRDADIVDGTLHAGGAPLTADAVRAVLRDTCAAAGAPAPPDIMVVSAWSGGGHDPGSGPLPANLPIEIDLWPRDEQTGCYADMTRSFVVGAVTQEVASLRDVIRAAIEAPRALARPGVTGRELYDAAAEIIEAAGYPTQRTARGERLTSGFYFSLGHGVGLDVHEGPALGLTGNEPLLAGDVIAIEPGVEGIPGIGGLRYEDLLLITEDGCETLTDYPYDLEP